MKTVQVVLDQSLLRAADQAARRLRRNRSALMRDALREHLRRLELRSAEGRERAAYQRWPQDLDEARIWEQAATWPAE